ELRVRVRLSRRRQRDQHRDPRRGHQDGRVPRVGRRRAARQQDQLRGAPHAHSLGHRGGVAGRALAAQEQGHRDEDAQEQIVPARGGKTGEEEGGARRDRERREFWQPDPELRVPAVYDGQRPPDRVEDARRARGDGRRAGSVHRGVPHGARERSQLRQRRSRGMTDDLNFVQRARREKLDALIARGIEPFAYVFERTHRATDAVALQAEGDHEDGPHVRVAGRIVALRSQGKTSFVHLADESGRIQLYFRKDVLGDAAYEVLSLLDIGDVIGVGGPLFRTRTGEVTVRVETLELLAKSLRPLPFGKEE